MTSDVGKLQKASGNPLRSPPPSDWSRGDYWVQISSYALLKLHQSEKGRH